MVNFSSDQKYLDQYGLSLFWDKVRQYIQNQIGGIDGTDIKLYPSGETNPTVTNQIENLLNTIDGSGGITDSIEAILSQYVKNIQHADPQTTPLKVVVNEGTGDKADFYTVTLEDNGLANTLSDLTSNRVKSLTPKNGGGSVTLGVDNNKGDVTLTINSQVLTNKVSGLETTINGMVKSVNKAENGDGTYVKLNIDPTTGDVKLSINDQSLVSELTSIKNNYVKTEDLPTTLPNPHKFTLTYRDKENQNKVVVYDGSSAKDVDFSLYHATTSTTATRVSNSLKVVDADGNVYDYNGGIKVDLSNGINYAANSGKLGGQLPSYYGKQSDITSISQKIAELEALTHVNQITTGDNTSDLVKIGFSNSTGNVVASIDETNLSNKLTSIDNYTINSKKISTSPVLTGSDITLGTSVGDDQNYPTTTTLTSSIQKLRQTIAGLGQVVELKGILTSLPSTTSGYKNGDVIIVGNKEYICYESQWYLLGDTTELSQDVSTIKSSYVKSIKGNGVGIVVTPTTSSTGDVTIGVDATSITNTLSNKADKSETIHGYNLQERIEDLNLGTTNRFFRTGGAPNNAPGQNGYVVGLTMALNNDPEYRVQLAYDQSINRLSYRQQHGNNGWMKWKTMALLTDIPTTLPANGGNADTVDGKHASDFAVANHNHDYLPLSGGTMSGGIIVETNSYTYDSPFKRKFDFNTNTGGWERGLLAGSWIKEGATDLSDNFVIGVYGNAQNLAYGYIGSNTTYDDLNHLRIYSDGKIGTPNILPNSNESFDLGSSIKKWRNIYATKVIGDLEGNAKTATTTENISKAPILEATDNEQITVQVGDKTSDPLTVPYATRSDFATDLTGRNEATIEEFTFRPSAGNKSIRDDSATIKRIKGNSVVWNQLVYPTKWNTDSVNGTVNMSDDYSEITHISAGNNNIAYIYSSNIVYPSREGHIMYFYAEVSKGYSFYACKAKASDGLTYSPIVKVTNDGLSTPLIAFYKNDGSNFEAGEEITIKNVVLFDLTQMFGAGNEPDTVEEFRALFPGNHYEHNPGQLVSMTADGLFTNGFNQWDEEWVNGYYRIYADSGVGNDGAFVENSSYIATAKPMKVLPNTQYYVKSPYGVLFGECDINGIYTGNHYYVYAGSTFTTSSNCFYLLFYVDKAITNATYNNDICINLSHTGVENGKYEPYWDETKDLSIIQKYFPNGMRSAGSIYDEISFDETTQKWVAIQRVGNVDLGSLSWAYSEHLFGGETVAGFKTSIEDIIFANTATTLPNITVSKYNINTADKVANGYAATETFTGYKAYKTDLSAYFTFTTDASEFKSSLSGIMLNYELAEPIITVIEEPINLSYKVGDFGIEQILSDSFSAPFRADIIYQFNATDRIRENSLNIEKLSKTQNEYLLLAGGTMSGQINSQDIKPVEDSAYQLGDSTHKYKNVFSDFFTGNLEGNAKTATSLYKSEMITSSSSTNKDKWIKFATVDVSASGYNRCSGHLIFSDNENGNFFGILGLYITTAATISNENASLRWISLDNILFKDSVAVVKVNDGIFDLYFKAAAHWLSPQVYYHGAHPEKITFNCGDASTYVDNITPLKVSSIDSQASNSDNALKLNGIDSSLYFKGTGILESDDFNNKTTLGLYRYNGITGKNGPADADPYGNLMVLRSGTHDTLTQLYFNIYNNRIFARSGSVSQFINNDWNKLAFTSDIPTSLKNPNKLTLKVGNNTPIEYDGSSAKTVNIDFAHKQEFTIGANKYAKITGGGIFTAFISVGSTLGNARHMSCWSSYGSGQSMRTNIKHIINGTDIYIDESDTGPIIYIKGYSQQTVIHILCSLSSFTCEELSSLPANVSITNTNSNNYTLAVKSDIPTTLKNPYSLTIQGNGTSLGTYDGSSAKTVNITPSSIGALALTGNASTATKLGNAGIWLYPENGNEVNFGGTINNSAVYFGYREKDSKPIPTIFIFGSSTGTAQIKAAGFIKKDSNDSHVLLGGGGHKAISDFATASKLGSSTIGATDRPIYLSGGSPVQTTYRMAGTNEVATTAVDISSATNTGIWYVNGTSSIYSQSDGVAIVNKYNDSWISQIYQDYRTGKLAVRGKNNGVWTEWKKIALTSDIPTSLPWSSITGKPAFTVDTSLSSTSTNPVQNKVINSALNNKMDKVTLATVATTGSYNDLTNKPTIPTTTSQLTNNSGFVDDKIKTPAITSFTTWDGVTKFGLRAWSNNATSRPNDYGIALDFAGDNGGYNWRNRLAFATEGKGIHYYYATNNNTLNYGGQLITTKGDYTLNGNLTASAFYISSDERLKTFGDDIKVDFDELAKLRKSHFVFNDNPTKQEIGVSAQEVQKIYPEIVNETEEGTLSVDYSKLAVVALAAIDKLNQRVQELENKLAKYE